MREQPLCVHLAEPPAGWHSRPESRQQRTPGNPPELFLPLVEVPRVGQFELGRRGRRQCSQSILVIERVKYRRLPVQAARSVAVS